MKIFLLCASLLSVLLAGCVHRPTPEQMASADYGSYPDNYKELIQQHFSKRLFDPYSAQYSDWRGPSSGYWSKPFGGETLFGYRACVEVNAKNRMGGYTGSKQYFFMIRNGSIIYEDGGYDGYGAMTQQVESNCNSVTYTPPPSKTKQQSKQPSKYGNKPGYSLIPSSTLKAE